MLLHPLEDFIVSQPRCHLFLDGLGSDFGEAEELLIQGAVEVIVSDRAGKLGPALVEQPGKDGVASQLTPQASRRGGVEIRCVLQAGLLFCIHGDAKKSCL